MPRVPEDRQNDTSLHDSAFAAMARGALAEASGLFAALLAREPGDKAYHYMRGLAHKYMLDWPTSLQHNLRAIELMDEMGEAEHWNAAIAATGLGDWARARALWRACGISVPDGEGPIVSDYGVAVVRLNPWHGGETVWMRRIDPVRARLLNVPLPESGHRFNDIVLHDGASTGHRWDGERKVPVFNALQRLEASDFATHVAFVSCESAEDLRALLDASDPGLGYIEDWTHSIRTYCMRSATARRIDTSPPARMRGCRTATSASRRRAASRPRRCCLSGRREGAVAASMASKCRNTTFPSASTATCGGGRPRPKTTTPRTEGAPIEVNLAHSSHFSQAPGTAFSFIHINASAPACMTASTRLSAYGAFPVCTVHTDSWRR